ncbi:MAG: hypothetical protein HC881_17195 [Leptolyngbyaceae cyanobacterium SL_7_1]|nr:hypothetical protein [Leptolyngbyaceae cyanobacterium SL_7_1]
MAGVLLEKEATQEDRSLPRWFRYIAIGLLVLGVFFRFYHLDRKAYWIDETHTSLRMSGHTKQEAIDELYTGEVISVDTLQQYQQLEPDKGWDDTLNALQGNAEHTPLYFLMARLWVQAWGYSVTVMRSLPALISLLLFPCLYWLCWELFRSPAVGWMAIALVAISPLHVLYAQEARPYSLWAVLIVLSSAILLWAIRSQHRLAWVGYGITVALGLYTQLLFGVVVMAHAAYVLLTNGAPNGAPSKGWLNRTLVSYGLATIAGILAFLPWVVLILTNLEQVQETTITLTNRHSFAYLLDRWFLNMSLVLVDRELASANILMVGLVGYAIYYLVRHAPKSTRWFLLTLVGIPFLTLALPDLLMGGERSERIRYLFPSYIAIQMTLAYLFASQVLWAKTWRQRAWRVVFVALVWSAVLSCSISSQAQVWWSKSNPRSGYYPVVSSIVNRSENTLLISDSKPPADIIAFSYWLDPDISIQLIENPNRLIVPAGFDSIYLLNPSSRLRNVMKRQNYRTVLMYIDRADSEEPERRLWHVRKNPE